MGLGVEERRRRKRGSVSCFVCLTASHNHSFSPPPTCFTTTTTTGLCWPCSRALIVLSSKSKSSSSTLEKKANPSQPAPCLAAFHLPSPLHHGQRYQNQTQCCNRLGAPYDGRDKSRGHRGWPCRRLLLLPLPQPMLPRLQLLRPPLQKVKQRPGRHQTQLPRPTSPASKARAAAPAPLTF